MRFCGLIRSSLGLYRFLDLRDPLRDTFSLFFTSFHVKQGIYTQKQGSFWTLGIVKCYLCWHHFDASIFYINEHRLNVSSFGINASLHFFDRLTNPLLPYTIRLMSLNLLLFPSTNPELSGWDIAFLTGAISFFVHYRKQVKFLLFFQIDTSHVWVFLV